MSRIKIIPMLLLVAVMGSCSKSDPTPEVSGGGDETTTAISLGTDISWATKGVAIDKLENVQELTLYSFDAYSADSWWDVASSEDLAPFFTDTTSEPLTLTTEDKGVTWDYTATTGGLRYWRADNAEAVTLFALYPESELTTTFDATTGKPEFAYTLSELTNENNDLVIDALFDLNNSKVEDGKVELSLQHALTKLSLMVATSGVVPPGEVLGYDGTDEYFYVNGISFSGLYNNATLDIELDNSGRVINWELSEETTIDVTAVQGNTLVAIYDENSDIIKGNALSSSSKSVMDEGEAIFMLPQLLGDDRPIAPTASVSVRRLYFTEKDYNAADAEYNSDKDSWDSTEGDFPYTIEDYLTAPSGELLYASEAITIPSATGSDGWVEGEHNVLSFVFYLDKLSEYDTPLTLSSQVYEWTYAADIEVTINPNTYIYTSDCELEIGSEELAADIYVYTNYTYDLRRHKRNIELDGSSTEAAGFTFYTSDGDRCEPLVVYDGNDYYYVYDSDNKLYLSLTDSYTESDSNILITQTDGVADLSDYEINGWMTFKIKQDDGSEFTYQAMRTTRDAEGLYTNTTVGDDSSYGVNKSGDDDVYILRFGTNAVPSKGGLSGYIGAELLSNGGGKITYKFEVSLTREND